MEMKPYIVYVKTDATGYITDINSSSFLPDTTGWTQIDQGHGDKYHHAKGNYFPQPIVTGGAYRYKLVDGYPVECTAEEIAEQVATLNTEPAPTLESRVHDLETDSAEMREALEMILSGVTE